MAISSPSRREAGFTLLEMLVALAIGAVAAGALAGLTRTLSPAVELTAAADQVAADFSRARAEARRTGEVVTVRLTDDGYRIDALGLDVAWPAAPVDAPAQIEFVPAAAPQLRPQLVLEHRGARAAVEIAAVSGRVHVQHLD